METVYDAYIRTRQPGEAFDYWYDRHPEYHAQRQNELVAGRAAADAYAAANLAPQTTAFDAFTVGVQTILGGAKAGEQAAREVLANPGQSAPKLPTPRTAVIVIGLVAVAYIISKWK